MYFWGLYSYWLYRCFFLNKKLNVRIFQRKCEFALRYSNFDHYQRNKKNIDFFFCFLEEARSAATRIMILGDFDAFSFVPVGEFSCFLLHFGGNFNIVQWRKWTYFTTKHIIVIFSARHQFDGITSGSMEFCYLKLK